MDKNTVDALKKYYQAMKELRDAFFALDECWINSDVAEFLDENCELYPFHKSFDELCFDVQEWYYQTGGNIQICLAAHELSEKLRQFDLTDGERTAVCEKLLAQYKEGAE